MTWTPIQDLAVDDAFAEAVWDDQVKGNLEDLHERAQDLDYVQITAPVSVTAGAEGTADTIISGTAQAYTAGRRLAIEFSCPAVRPGAAGSVLTFVLLRGSTVLGQVQVEQDSGGGTQGTPAKIEFIDAAPPGGTYAYVVKAFVASGTGTVRAGTGGSGSLVPAFLRVRRADA